jgi:hypothetical protein
MKEKAEYFALEVTTNNGRCYVTGDESADPRLIEAKLFRTISSALDYRKKHWNDKELNASVLVVNMEVSKYR